MGKPAAVWKLASGEVIVLADGLSRTAAFSAKDGKALGRWFGRPIEISRDGRMVASLESGDRLVVRKAVGGEMVAESAFQAQPVSVRFAQDGGTLMVLLDSQQVVGVRLPER